MIDLLYWNQIKIFHFFSFLCVAALTSVCYQMLIFLSDCHILLGSILLTLKMFPLNHFTWPRWLFNISSFWLNWWSSNQCKFRACFSSKSLLFSLISCRESNLTSFGYPSYIIYNGCCTNICLCFPHHHLSSYQERTAVLNKSLYMLSAVFWLDFVWVFLFVLGWFCCWCWWCWWWSFVAHLWTCAFHVCCHRINQLEGGHLALHSSLRLHNISVTLFGYLHGESEPLRLFPLSLVLLSYH